MGTRSSSLFLRYSKKTSSEHKKRWLGQGVSNRANQFQWNWRTKETRCRWQCSHMGRVCGRHECSFANVAPGQRRRQVNVNQDPHLRLQFSRTTMVGQVRPEHGHRLTPAEWVALPNDVTRVAGRAKSVEHQPWGIPPVWLLPRTIWPLQCWLFLVKYKSFKFAVRCLCDW